MIFNGNDLSRYLVVESVSRDLLPKRRLETTEVSAMDGAHVADTGLETLEISVTCRLLAESAADVSDCRRLLAHALHSSTAARLILPDEPDRYYLAWFEGGSAPSGSVRYPQVKLSFLCADPVAYGEAKTATVGTSNTIVSAGGTYKACPVITCKPASGSYWQLTNVTTGDFVRVEAAFTGSQTVVLDMARERCTVNGTDHAVTLTSDFFALDGTQTLKTSSGTASLEWEERWL